MSININIIKNKLFVFIYSFLIHILLFCFIYYFTFQLWLNENNRRKIEKKFVQNLNKIMNDENRF